MKDFMRGTLYSWTKAESYEEAEKRLGIQWFSVIEEADSNLIKTLPEHLEEKKEEEVVDMKGLLKEITHKEKEWIAIDCDFSVYEKIKNSIGKKLTVNILGKV